MLYAVFGFVLIYLTTDIRHYRDLIALIAILTCIGGAFLTGLDFWAGMPPSWSWTEGPPMILIGLWMLWLARRVP